MKESGKLKHYGQYSSTFPPYKYADKVTDHVRVSVYDITLGVKVLVTRAQYSSML